MSVSFYCKDCSSLMGPVNFTSGMMFCSKCNRPEMLPEDDKTVLIIASNSAKRGRELTELEIHRLSGLPTTAGVPDKCTNCNFPFVDQIYDTEYRFTLVCPKCNMQFKR